MKLTKAMIYSAAFMGIFAMQSASAATIVGAVLNNSFEADSIGSTSATSWSTTNRGFGTSSVAIVGSPGVTDGTRAGTVTVTQGDDYGVVFNQLRSTSDLLGVGMINGETYTLSADYTPSVTEGPQIEFGYSAFGPGFANYTQNYVVVSGAGVGVAGVTSNVSINFVFNSDLQSDSFYFEARTGSYGAPVSFTLDNFKISSIPEPTSLTLLGLAGGAVALRRRRK